MDQIMLFSFRSAFQSSKQSLHSWNAEEVGSASELIGLGVSARTFTDKQEGKHMGRLCFCLLSVLWLNAHKVY